MLPSEILKQAMPRLNEFSRHLPPGYRIPNLSGEEAKQKAGFANLAKVLIISMLGIYAALLLQFNNARSKAAARLRRDALRGRGSPSGIGDHGLALRLYGLPGDRRV